MSADNGIYILQTKDQYRVAHLQAIDNITWSAIDGNLQNNEGARGRYVPTRVVEMWGKSKYTKDRTLAFKIAYKWAGSLPICEYGVNVIIYNKMWKHIVRDAEKYAKKEMEYIKKNRKNSWNMEILQSLADGSYADGHQETLRFP